MKCKRRGPESYLPTPSVKFDVRREKKSQEAPKKKCKKKNSVLFLVICHHGGNNDGWGKREREEQEGGGAIGNLLCPSSEQWCDGCAANTTLHRKRGSQGRPNERRHCEVYYKTREAAPLCDLDQSWWPTDLTYHHARHRLASLVLSILPRPPLPYLPFSALSTIVQLSKPSSPRGQKCRKDYEVLRCL